MKTNGSLGYLIKEGFRNIYVNKLMSVASVSVLLSCLMIIGSAFLMFENIKSIIDSVENQNVITVYYPDGVAGDPDDQLGKDIKNTPNVDPESVEFISNEQAYREMVAESPDLAANLDSEEEKAADAFPDSYKVRVEKMKDFSDTVSALKKLNGVGEVRGSSQFAEKLISIRGTVSYISIGIISMLLLVSLFIISNTIKITMFSRRLEISIMRSVGATSWFIRLPFMLEGIILGIISGVLATLAVWGIYEASIRPLTDFLKNLGGREALPFSHYAFIILCGFTGIGILAGTFGSTISIAKYLKEKEFVDYEEKN